jgi:hypothetical protein
MRDLLLARIQPVIEQMAEQLVELLLERIDQHMNQLELAFDAATSAFASDLSVTDGAARQHDVRDEDGESRPSTQPRSRVISPARDTRSARGSRGGRKNAPLIRASSAPTMSQRQEPDSERVATNVSSSNRALQQGKDLPPSNLSRRTCGCGPVGRHRKTCALRSTSPASGPSDPALTHSPAASPISRPPAREPGRSERSPASSGLSSAPVALGAPKRPDRFAQIESSAQRREALKRDRGERARSFARKDGVRPTRAPAAAPVDPHSADSEAEADQEPELPASVRASFQF